MCGIVGYTGFRNATDVVVDCLQRLEYRGYDSFGLAVQSKDLKVFKQAGSLSDVADQLPSFPGKTGLGHTRWATHGAANKINAHPHQSSDNRIVVVHNGIIENYMVLKEWLADKGIICVSRTDTEVIAQLIAYYYQDDLEQAVKQTLPLLQGSYALGVMSQDEPNTLIGVRQHSPLVIGVGDQECFLASDIPAFLPYTRRVIFLEDEQYCVLNHNKHKIYGRDEKRIESHMQTINWDVAESGKAGFDHYMLKEIYEQPTALHHSLEGRLQVLDRTVHLPDKVEDLLQGSYRMIYIVACGTSYYAGLISSYLLQQRTHLPVMVLSGSEFRYHPPPLNDSLIIAVTQSGETADTLAGLRIAHDQHIPSIVVTNVMGSTATRLADGTVLLQSGPEIGVGATKTFTSQLMVLCLIALKYALLHQILSGEQQQNWIDQLQQTPELISQILQDTTAIQQVASQIKSASSVFYIGRGPLYPVALEGALKLKEISYIHAEGFAAGELKHGPFALLTKKTPVIALLGDEETYEKMMTSIDEVNARGSPVIGVSHQKDNDLLKHADYHLSYPKAGEIPSIFESTVILQLLAYYTAKYRDCSIDKPRNLAKSVTVE